MVNFMYIFLQLTKSENFRVVFLSINIRTVYLIGKYKLLKSRNAISLLYPYCFAAQSVVRGQQHQYHLGSLLEMDSLDNSQDMEAT